MRLAEKGNCRVTRPEFKQKGRRLSRERVSTRTESYRKTSGGKRQYIDFILRSTIFGSVYDFLIFENDEDSFFLLAIDSTWGLSTTISLTITSFFGFHLFFLFGDIL